ncbi:MAG TPA: TRIC cation channel family protein, partial [Lacunisphaera sp.]|nr:TRIC cation channel family protein [Lacunisphaera sp.]
MLKGSFDLPIVFDLGATFAFALTGALAAIKRHYDIVGVLALALVSG